MSKTSPGRNGQFAPDDLVLGLDIAVNINSLDVELLALVNLKFQIHRAGVHVRNARDLERGALFHINVSFAAVKILDGLHVLVEAVGRENIAHVHRQVHAGRACPARARKS